MRLILNYFAKLSIYLFILSHAARLTSKAQAAKRTLRNLYCPRIPVRTPDHIPIYCRSLKRAIGGNVLYAIRPRMA
jgi:hypothetical protein